MMRSIFAVVLGLFFLSSCDVIDGIRASRAAGKSEGEALKLTRAMVEESDLALIRGFLGEEDKIGSFLLANAVNNGTVSYGKKQRSTLLMRQSLLVGTYSLGNDLLNVRANEADPIQNHKPLAQWPNQTQRIYVLPGAGLKNDERLVNCRYDRKANLQIEVLERFHNVTEVHEHCQGENLNVTNIYWVDAASGFVWKSKQYAGDVPYSLIIEVIEPLEY